MSKTDSEIETMLTRLVAEMMGQEPHSNVRNYTYWKEAKSEILDMLHEAEIRGMLAVNNCHGCVDNNPDLKERLAELKGELTPVQKMVFHAAMGDDKPSSEDLGRLE